MNRYNIFAQVHKGLRAMLYETALCLQQTDFTNTEEAAHSLELLVQTVDLFDQHAHTEDTMVFSTVVYTDAALVNVMEQEHQEDHALAQRLRGLLTAFSHAVSFADTSITGEAITNCFVEFMIFNLKHMAKEEDQVNKALWKKYTDTELHALTQKIVTSIPAQHLVQFNRWMMRGLNNSEITGWLKEVKNNAPDIVFQSLMQTAAAELEAPRWQQVQDAITEGAMLA